MAEKRNTYEKQSQLSLLLAGVSALFTVGLAGLMYKNFHREYFEIIYAANGKWYPIVLGVIALGLVSGGIGFLIGLNSAGQKRNTKSKLAWQGFFGNALTVTLTLCLALFFLLTRQPLLGNH